MAAPSPRRALLNAEIGRDARSTCAARYPSASPHRLRPHQRVGNGIGNRLRAPVLASVGQCLGQPPHCLRPQHWVGDGLGNRVCPIARYKQALDEGASPAVVTAWITEAEHQRAEALVRRAAVPRQDDALASMTVDDIAALITELGDLADALQEADPEHKLDLYRSLRLKLIYSADTNGARRN